MAAPTDDLSPQQIIDLLGLEPLPEEGGMWTTSWREEGTISAIYFLVRPGDFSALHRLSMTELWHHYAGAPVQMLLLAADGGIERPVLGTDLAAGQRPFVAVPAGVWMGAATEGEWSLLGTSMSPPYEHGHFELGHRADLVASHPAAAAEIEALTRDPETDR